MDKPPTHIVYDSIRSLPLMLNADQACWVLGIGRANFFRLVQAGSIKQGEIIGKRSRRWPKAYIISLMGGLDPHDDEPDPVAA